MLKIQMWNISQEKNENSHVYESSFFLFLEQTGKVAKSLLTLFLVLTVTLVLLFLCF